MSKNFTLGLIVVASGLISSATLWAGTEGAINGTVTDNQGIAVPNAQVQLRSAEGKVLKEVTTDATGNYSFFPVQFGDYSVATKIQGFAPSESGVHVSSGANADVEIQLTPPESGQEMVLKVEAKRKMVQNSSSTSSTTVDKEQIATMPQGNDISLPRLLETTTPGVVQGPFNQIFIRGNHANIQYQIDGVQLPIRRRALLPMPLARATSITTKSSRAVFRPSTASARPRS